MKITEVRYEQLRSFGEYQNETIGVTVQVDDGDGADEALSAARGWVIERLSERVEDHDLRERVGQLRYQARDLENRIEKGRAELEKFARVFERLGLDAPWRSWDDVPF